MLPAHELALLTAGALSLWVLSARLRELDLGRGGRAPPPSTSVVVPARNEAKTLPRLLASLAAQDRPPLEVLVVDDASTDDTAAVVRRAPGVTLLTAPPRPPGWTGKAWACHLGATAARGELLVFLDADVELAPDALHAIASAAGPGLLSVQPRHEPGSAIEELSAIPNLVAVLGTGLASVLGVGASGFAFGPCLATRRSTYLGVGGHSSVRGEVVEDLALARRFEARGLPTAARLGGERVRYRMYPDGLAQQVEGWTKNMALGARRARPSVLVAVVLWVGAALLSAGLVVRAVADAADPRPALLLYAGFAGSLRALLRHVGSFRGAVAWLYPVGMLWFVGLFVGSLVATGVLGRVRWRGRTIALRPDPVVR